MSSYQRVLIHTLPVWLFLLLIYLMQSLNPISSGPGGILLIFLVMYLFTVSSFFTVLRLVLNLLTRSVTARQNVSPKKYYLSRRKAYYFASVLAFGPVLLIALNSVRQLTVLDIVLVSLVLVIAVFYISRRSN